MFLQNIYRMDENVSPRRREAPQSISFEETKRIKSGGRQSCWVTQTRLSLSRGLQAEGSVDLEVEAAQYASAVTAAEQLPLTALDVVVRWKEENKKTSAAQITDTTSCSHTIIGPHARASG